MNISLNIRQRQVTGILVLRLYVKAKRYTDDDLEVLFLM